MFWPLRQSLLIDFWLNLTHSALADSSFSGETDECPMVRAMPALSESASRGPMSDRTQSNTIVGSSTQPLRRIRVLTLSACFPFLNSAAGEKKQKIKTKNKQPKCLCVWKVNTSTSNFLNETRQVWWSPNSGHCWQNTKSSANKNEFLGIQKSRKFTSRIKAVKGPHQKCT